MKRSAFIFLAAAFALGVFLFQTRGTNAVQANEAAVIEKAIRASIGWCLSKDRPQLESVMAHDDSLFIFNPDASYTVGWDQFAKGFDFWLDSRFKTMSYQIRNLRLTVSRSGTVAWWSCILDENASWDGRSIAWKDTRWTGVLEKRAGKWLIVQMHFSFSSK